MTERMTSHWMRNFVNAGRMSSFRDKIGALHAEQNPFYIVEWVLLREEDGDADFWSAWEGERTPGAERGTLTDVRTCCAEQLPIALLLNEAENGDAAVKLAAALHDLEAVYGSVKLAKGAEAAAVRLELAAGRYEQFSAELQQELDRLSRRTAERLKELDAEAEEVEGIDLAAERRAVLAKSQREEQELPGKVLNRLFPDDALLRTLAFASGTSRPAERARGAAAMLREAASSHSPREWTLLLEQGKLPPAGSAAFAWIASVMHRSAMTRGRLQPEPRQRAALRAIAAAVREDPEHGDEWMAAAFRAEGWEERLAEPEFANGTLHFFVWHALGSEALRRRLREEAVLRHWDAFAERMDAESDFEASSWLLLLDPENVQQRLLRRGAAEAVPVIRKLCGLYAEAIRRGLAPGLVSSLYDYLAKHDAESFYSFTFGLKSLAEAVPLLSLAPAALSRLFRGGGVRQAAARKHLLQLLYDDLDDEVQPGLPPETYRKLADILAEDKREAAVGWLHRHERDWRRRIGSGKAKMFARMLRFRWIGTAERKDEQHRTVADWLARRCDWVQFDSDLDGAADSEVRYAVVKPGAIDADTGEVLVRARVRAEWSDASRISSLLDDLKQL